MNSKPVESCTFSSKEDRRKCAVCNQSLGDEAVMALNRLWHPEHFRCSSCENPIRQTYQAAENKPYCVQCFAKNFNPKCAGCHETLVDTCLLALDKHWHPQCFRCNGCSKPLANGEYYLVDDKPYDLDCHWAKRLDKRLQLQTKERQQRDGRGNDY
ncbi:Protein Y1A5A.1 [Aphelenchoides avenae]|nr:Protein Y1A5A.1 [Aphelenchus avenae]